MTGEKSKQKTLTEIQALTRGKIRVDARFELSVTAGITEVSSADDIEQIIKKAEVNLKIIAAYKCAKEVGST